MKSYVAFFKKELLESIRSGKLLFILILFFCFGVMNPAIAKLTPWLLDYLSDALAESGMNVTQVEVDAMTSWTQFFKNIPMALIAFVFLYGNSLTREYESGTLILVLTKGLSRYKVLLAKLSLMLGLWSVGYWFCFSITYLYNGYFWDNAVAQNLFVAVFYWWLFGAFILCTTLLFSVVFRNYSSVLLSTGGVVLVCYLVGLLSKMKSFVPTALMNGMSLLLGVETARDYLGATIVTVALCAFCIGVSMPIMNKKSL